VITKHIVITEYDHKAVGFMVAHLYFVITL